MASRAPRGDAGDGPVGAVAARPPTTRRCTACIAHGDYRLATCCCNYQTEPRVVAVLDWELATIGNPLADLGYFCVTYHVPGGPGGRSGVAG